jgi:integrase/recombinase XerD
MTINKSSESGFRLYLHHRQLSPKSIHTYQRYCNIFTAWLETEKLEATEITYTDMLNFIKHAKEQGLKPGYIMKILGAVRHYFNYLKYIDKIQTNPANGLYIRGKQRRIPHDLLTAEQLDEMYTKFDAKLKDEQTRYKVGGKLVAKRNKIILGLLIYQGINTQELGLLEPEHLKLREGKIIIPGTLRSNRRTLNLEAHQMIDLQEYIQKTRMLILEITEKQTEKLFMSIGQSSSMSNSIDKLMRSLRKEHSYFVNVQQIRQSRISIWVKQYDLRQAQYMAGHKYVGSTERYQSTNLEDLQKELEKCHPSRK